MYICIQISIYLCIYTCACIFSDSLCSSLAHQRPAVWRPKSVPKGLSTQIVDNLGPNGFLYRYFGPWLHTVKALGPLGFTGLEVEVVRSFQAKRCEQSQGANPIVPLK